MSHFNSETDNLLSILKRKFEIIWENTWTSHYVNFATGFGDSARLWTRSTLMNAPGHSVIQPRLKVWSRGAFVTFAPCISYMCESGAYRYKIPKSNDYIYMIAGWCLVDYLRSKCQILNASLNSFLQKTNWYKRIIWYHLLPIVNLYVMHCDLVYIIYTQLHVHSMFSHSPMAH